MTMELFSVKPTVEEEIELISYKSRIASPLIHLITHLEVLKNANPPSDISHYDGHLFPAYQRAKLHESQGDTQEFDDDDWDEDLIGENIIYEPVDSANETAIIKVIVYHTTILVENRRYQLEDAVTSVCKVSSTSNALCIVFQSKTMILLNFYCKDDVWLPYITQWWKLDKSIGADIGRELHANDKTIILGTLSGVIQQFETDGVTFTGTPNLSVSGKILHCVLIDGSIFVIYNFESRVRVAIIRTGKLHQMTMKFDFDIPVKCVALNSRTVLGVHEGKVTHFSIEKLVSGDPHFEEFDVLSGFPVEVKVTGDCAYILDENGKIVSYPDNKIYMELDGMSHFDIYGESLVWSTDNGSIDCRTCSSNVRNAIYTEGKLFIVSDFVSLLTLNPSSCYERKKDAIDALQFEKLYFSDPFALATSQDGSKLYMLGDEIKEVDGGSFLSNDLTLAFGCFEDKITQVTKNCINIFSVEVEHSWQHELSCHSADVFEDYILTIGSCIKVFKGEIEMISSPAVPCNKVKILNIDFDVYFCFINGFCWSICNSQMKVLHTINDVSDIDPLTGRIAKIDGSLIEWGGCSSIETGIMYGRFTGDLIYNNQKVYNISKQKEISLLGSTALLDVHEVSESTILTFNENISLFERLPGTNNAILSSLDVSEDAKAAYLSLSKQLLLVDSASMELFSMDMSITHIPSKKQFTPSCVCDFLYTKGQSTYNFVIIGTENGYIRIYQVIQNEFKKSQMFVVTGTPTNVIQLDNDTICYSVKNEVYTFKINTSKECKGALLRSFPSDVVQLVVKEDRLGVVTLRHGFWILSIGNLETEYTFSGLCERGDYNTRYFVSQLVMLKGNMYAYFNKETLNIEVVYRDSLVFYRACRGIAHLVGTETGFVAVEINGEISEYVYGDSCEELPRELRQGLTLRGSWPLRHE